MSFVFDFLICFCLLYVTSIWKNTLVLSSKKSKEAVLVGYCVALAKSVIRVAFFGGVKLLLGHNNEMTILKEK